VEVAFICIPYQNVVKLQVVVNETFLMECLQAANYLNPYLANGLQSKRVGTLE